MKRLALGFVIFLSTTCAGFADAPPDTQPASQPTMQMVSIFDKLNSLPKNLWPSPGELPIRATARDAWISENIKPEQYTFTGKIQNAVESSYVSGEPGDGQTKAERNHKAIQVTLDCGTAEVWGHTFRITCDGAVPDVPLDVAASWDKNTSASINGTISYVPNVPVAFAARSNDPPPIEISIKAPASITVMSAASTQPVTYPTLADMAKDNYDPKAVVTVWPPSSFSVALNGMPKDYWPIDGEIRARGELRQQWLVSHVTGKTSPSFGLTGKVTGVASCTVMVPTLQPPPAHLKPVKVVTPIPDVYKDEPKPGVLITIDCGREYIWGNLTHIVATGGVAGLSLDTANGWEKNKQLRISGKILRATYLKGELLITIKDPARISGTE